MVPPPLHAPKAHRATHLAAALALAALFLAGCISPRLVDERRQAPYAGLLARYEALPHAPQRFAVQVPGSTAVRVGLDVVTTERGAGGAVLVLQPGILSDGSSWRFLMGELGAEHDLIAVDPPGTRSSDAPEPRAAGPEAYSPTWTAAHTLAAIEEYRSTECGSKPRSFGPLRPSVRLPKQVTLKPLGFQPHSVLRTRGAGARRWLLNC